MLTDESHSHRHGCCANHAASNQSVTETLEELDFARGLWKAAVDGDLERIQQLLLSSKHDPNQRDCSGLTPLHYAARHGHTQCCLALLDAGAELNASTRASNATALHRASAAGHTDVVRLLLNKGACVEMRNADGKTAKDVAKHDGVREVFGR